jgi:4-hydroxy-2-oxoheptanedioate aldolase
MRSSKVLAKLRENKFVRTTALGHVIPGYLKIAAEFGYENIWLDLEHRAMDDRELQMLLAYGHAVDIDIMVRTPTLEKSKLYRLMEDGASGVMIPHCSTPERAQMIVDAVKFPPIGDRGYDGAGFDSGFTLDDPDTYLEDANRETFVVCQIETVEAVGNADKIAAIDGVDVLFIGPGDLGIRMKLDPGGMVLDDAMNAVSDACQKHGKKWGITAGTTDELADRAERGASMIPWGGDFKAMLNMLKTGSAELDDMSL